METMDTAITMAAVTVRYGRRPPALERLDLTVPAGSFISVVGPNGAGKTTLLKAIMGLVPLAAGVISLCGQRPAQGRKLAAFVPQRETVDWMFPVTVQDVAVMGRINHLHYGGRIQAADRQAVMNALERVGLADLAGYAIGDLSGGQQQRAFLARALCQEAKVLLLDEPFNAIDVTTQELLLRVLQDFVSTGGTVLAATHDLGVAARYFSQMLLLNRAVVAFGPPAQVFRPELLQEAFNGKVVIWEHSHAAKADELRPAPESYDPILN